MPPAYPIIPDLKRGLPARVKNPTLTNPSMGHPQNLRPKPVPLVHEGDGEGGSADRSVCATKPGPAKGSAFSRTLRNDEGMRHPMNYSL